MPRIVSTLEFTSRTTDRIWQMMRRVYEQLAIVVNGGLSFGTAYVLTATPDRSRSDNIDCVWIEVAISIANVDFVITHNLGRLLNAYIIARKSNAVDIYDSPTMFAVPPGQTQTWMTLYGKQQYIVRATVPATMVLLLF